VHGTRGQFRRWLPGGFTLVELLVVIGVVATLIAIVLPALSRARQASQALECASNQRQWATAVQLYANQEHGWLPRRGQGVQMTTVINRPSDWFNALPPMLHLPSFNDLVTAGKMPRPGDHSFFVCPSAVDGSQQYFFSYAMNMRLSTWDAPLPDRINRIGSWSTVVFLTDGPGTYCSVLPTVNNYCPLARHHGRSNIAFLDGHVASYTGQEIGCGVGDPKRPDVRWMIPYSIWPGPAGDTE